MSKLEHRAEGRPDESSEELDTTPGDVAIEDAEGRMPEDEDAASTAPSDITAGDDEARPDA